MTYIEMIQHKSFYIDQHRHDGLTLVSGTYDEELNSCSINFTNCSALVFHGASTVVGKPIRSFYPSLNGVFDNSVGILNRIFSHRNAENEKNSICIIWSSVQPFSGIGTWVPNHFVLIKPNSRRVYGISTTFLGDC
jgi:hypothetical protein